MITNTISHPGLERLGRSYDWFAQAFAALYAKATAWGGWTSLRSAFERWGEARVMAIAMQDPRVRAEILAAAARQENANER